MWRASTFLMSLLEDMGAEAKLVVAVEGTSPVVFGRIIKVGATGRRAIGRDRACGEPCTSGVASQLQRLRDERY